MRLLTRPRAVVLLSGGLDSATTLAMAQADGFECFCLSFDYGQRHLTEIRFRRPDSFKARGPP